jgi:cell division transport system ATP-binding protein
MAAMIEFENVSRVYEGGITALKDVTLSISPGELVFLSGHSGAGKSTLLKLIAGIERPSSGTLTVNGHDIGRIKPTGIPFLRRNLGLILQQHHLLMDRSILANVMLPLLVTGELKSEAEKRARAALEKVDLLDRSDTLPAALSGGEQQRAAIARAIVNRPQIILADEPTTSLDRESAKKVFDAITFFQSAGVTCLIATHDDQFVERASRVIHLRQGQLTGTSSSLTPAVTA